MPLLSGRSRRVINANTAMLIHEGRKPKQAYAIANSKAGTSRQKKRKAKRRTITRA